MSLLSLHHQDAAQALFELRSAKPSLAAPLPALPFLPSTPATTPTLPLFILPNLSAFSVMAATSQQQHHQQQQLPLLSTYLAGGNSPFFPSLLPLPPSPWPTTATSAASPAPTSENNINNNNQRLSVSYLLNNDDSTTTALIKQESDAVPSSPASSFSSSPSSSPKRKATSRPSTSLPKEKRLKAEVSSPVSTPPPSSSSAPASSLPQATAVASAFKGDLSLFPHLQLQLQREQLDPQQHTELVLKVWNRQQQVLKLQQLQHKKQELKAQRLQQRSQRKSGGAANNNKDTASPASPLTPPSSSPSSPSPASSSSPSSPTTGPAADVVSALPTLDDILNGADVQVDEASDEEAAAKGQKKPRRRISARQVAVLEQVFAVEPFPGPSTKKVIAKKLGMKERSITIWFQNKRARLKRIDNEHKEHHESESGGKREVTFHNLAVGFDGKLDMLPEDH